MHFEISSPGRLTGSVLLPGDRNLTLLALAFGTLSHKEIIFTHISPSPDVKKFVHFLENYGAEVDTPEESIKLRGKEWQDTVRINEAVKDSIIHCVIGSAVFSSQTVIVTEGAGNRSFIVSPLLDLLKTVGLHEENISVEDNDIIVRGAVFSPMDNVTVHSARAFESIAAAACSVNMPVVLSYPVQLVTQSIKLLTLLGCNISSPEKGNDRNHELSRRLARAEMGKINDTGKFEWNGNHASIIGIPGDSTIAAAVCGAASLLQGSDVTVEGVVWERGRRGFFESLRRMKIDAEWKPDKKRYSFDSADVRVRWSKSDGIHLSSEQAESMLTELLVLGSVAASASGETVITDTGDIPSYSRSDSFKVLARGLEKLGAHVGDFSEGMVLQGVGELKGNSVDSGGEADVALALAVAGLAAGRTTKIKGFKRDNYPVKEFIQIIENLSSDIQ